jgi:hypothetical protein
MALDLSMAVDRSDDLRGQSVAQRRRGACRPGQGIAFRYSGNLNDAQRAPLGLPGDLDASRRCAQNRRGRLRVSLRNLTKATV